MNLHKLDYDEESDSYTDGFITVTDFRTCIFWRKVKGQNGNIVDVPGCFSCHGTVRNISKFMSKLTLFAVLVDDDNYNLGAIKGSVLCFDKDENWEFFGKIEDLEYYDAATGTTGDKRSSKIRGEKVTAYSHEGRWKNKVYAIEEFAQEPDEDISGCLGSIG